MFQDVLLTLAGLTLAAAPVAAQTASGDEVLLKPGDPAPPISIETWVKGDPVESFEPGKLYVVEFWATWCGPCIQSMPHLSELQKEYRDKGLTIISVTRTNERNTPEQVQEMVAAKGDIMSYTVAMDKDGETSAAYMDAAQQGGIPTCFLVNREGKVVYIGHPMWLDLVLERVVAGTWDVAKSEEEIAKADEELRAVFEAAGEDPAAALEKLQAFSQKHPGVAKMFRTLHFSLLLDAGRLDEGYELGRKIVAEAIESKDVNTLVGVGARIADPEQELERRDLELARKALTSAKEITKGEDPWPLMFLARVNSLEGKHEEALALAQQAVDQADGDRMKEYLQGVLDELKEAAGQ